MGLVKLGAQSLLATLGIATLVGGSCDQGAGALQPVATAQLQVAGIVGSQEVVAVRRPRPHSSEGADSAGEAGSTEARASVAEKEAPSPLAQAVARVRIEDYGGAKMLLDQLTPAEALQPHVRYLRAKVAKELGNCEQALEFLPEDPKALGALEAHGSLLKTECVLSVGPKVDALLFDRAVAALLASKDASDWVRAGEALVSAGQRTKARAALGRAIPRLPKKNASMRVRARLARIQAATDEGARTKDRKWLAMEYPTLQAGREAERALRQASKPAFSARERAARAKALCGAGLSTLCKEELGQFKGLLSHGERLSLEGYAYYRERRYLEAAEVLKKAVAAGSKQPEQDLFYRARALSRADEDQAAIDLYRQLAKRYRKTAYADHADYYAARLLFILGRWQEAQEAYSRYQKVYGKRARHRGEARRESGYLALILGKGEPAHRALTELLTRHPKRSLFEHSQAIAFDVEGRRDQALTLHQKLAVERPFELAGLLSRLRLGTFGDQAKTINTMPFPPSTPSLIPPLPERVLALSRLGLERAAERELLLAEDRIAESFPLRRGEALCGAYGQLQVAARRFRIGSSQAKADAFSRPPRPEDRWIFECAYPRPYAEYIRELATERVPEDLVYAVMRQESGFNTGAESHADARGLMQIIPPTARKIARDLNYEVTDKDLARPAINLKFGVYYLDKLVRLFEGSVPLALAAYNAGPIAVSRWAEAKKDLPLDLFVATIPFEETRNYVDKVMSNWLMYAHLSGNLKPIEAQGLNLPRVDRAKVDY